MVWALSIQTVSFVIFQIEAQIGHVDFSDRAEGIAILNQELLQISVPARLHDALGSNDEHILFLAAKVLHEG